MWNQVNVDILLKDSTTMEAVIYHIHEVEEHIVHSWHKAVGDVEKEGCRKNIYIYRQITFNTKASG